MPRITTSRHLGGSNGLITLGRTWRCTWASSESYSQSNFTEMSSASAPQVIQHQGITGKYRHNTIKLIHECCENCDEEREICIDKSAFWFQYWVVARRAGRNDEPEMD